MKKIFLFFICALIFICGCYNLSIGKKSNHISEKSKFFADDQYIYYTNCNGDLYKYALEDNSNQKILKDFYLSAFNEKYFVSYNENTIKAYNRNNEQLFEINNIKTQSMDILDNKLFYVNERDNNYIYVIDLDSKINKLFLKQATNNISVNNKYLFYENNANSIYKYSFIEKNNELFFEGTYCFYFNCDDKYVYLSDYQNNNCITKIDINTKNIEKYNIKSCDFYLYKKYIYYISLIDENNYSEKTVFHIFRFNVYDKTDEMLF